MRAIAVFIASILLSASASAQPSWYQLPYQNAPRPYNPPPPPQLVPEPNYGGAYTVITPGRAPQQMFVIPPPAPYQPNPCVYRLGGC